MKTPGSFGSHTNLTNGSKGILLGAIPQLTAVHTGLKGPSMNIQVSYSKHNFKGAVLYVHKLA